MWWRWDAWSDTGRSFPTVCLVFVQIGQSAVARHQTQIQDVLSSCSDFWTVANSGLGGHAVSDRTVHVLWTSTQIWSHLDQYLDQHLALGIDCANI